MNKNTDALTILITVFTVFAGFLVAIIAVLGDPSTLPEGSWEKAENRREKIEGQLIRHGWLFIAYIIAIGLLFAGALVEEAKAVPDFVKLWIDRAYLFVGVFAFLMTFGLARSMMTLQMVRIDAEIASRRKKAGLSD